MLKFGDKVIVRDGSALDGVVGVIYRIGEGKAVVLLDREVLWPVDQCNLEKIDNPGMNKLPAF
jgi:hypothetical protein